MKRVENFLTNWVHFFFFYIFFVAKKKKFFMMEVRKAIVVPISLKRRIFGCFFKEKKIFIFYFLFEKKSKKLLKLDFKEPKKLFFGT